MTAISLVQLALFLIVLVALLLQQVVQRLLLGHSQR